jgi:vacuolar iron transporter family protein
VLVEVAAGGSVHGGDRGRREERSAHDEGPVAARSRHPSEIQPRDHIHRAVGTGGARAAVFGISDGLVTNVALILGIAGAHPAGSVVRLAGIAGLVAGAFSMSAGEYVSMRAQTELFERELALENHEIQNRPEGERRELVRIYENRGIETEVAQRLARELMRTPELALETHAREELGINPNALGSPAQAAAFSFATFAVGALLPLLPWLVTSGTAAILGSVVIGAVAALGVGTALAVFTRRTWWRSALRQLLVSAVAASVTFGIGHAVGVSSFH